MTAINQQLNTAMAAHARGDLVQARRIGEAVLRANPNNGSLLQWLGAVCCQAGDVASGVKYMRQAMSRGADTLDNRLNLANALMTLGRHDEALEVCTGPVAEGSPELQRMHAMLLKAQGKVEDAIATYEALVARKPDDFDSWNNLGNARHERGDLEGALAALQQARLLDSQSSLVHINMARVLISMDRHEEACLLLETASRLAPKDPTPLLELGRTLVSIDHPENGLRALGAAARLDPKDPTIFVEMAAGFAALSDQAKAEQAYRFALKADPTFVPAFLNLGILLEKANRIGDLETLIAHARKSGIEKDKIAYLDALLLSRKGALEEALAIARTVTSRAIGAATRAQFVGQLADRLGHVDEAYAAFEEMNRAMAQSALGVGMDRSAYRQGIDRLAAQTTAEWFAGWPSQGPSQDSRPSPVFLIGFPRSGTTLLDTLLMGNSGTHVLEELPILETVSNEAGGLERLGAMDADTVASLRALYFRELDRLSPQPPGKLVIDKNPLSMIRVPLIHRLFPDARIILAMRHPCDVVLSCYMQNFKPTEAMSSFLDLTNASRTYDRIFAYWEQCRTIFPIDVHMLRYEAMIADTEGTMRALTEYLGLPWEQDALDHRKTAVARGYIRTPSYAQVTEQIYKSANGRWERYRHHMRYALPVLAPWVERYGYALD